jgi:YHS domain-containing protein
MTKANAEFTWVIGGKPYQFCCPPCVDEFLALAKKSPEKVNAPETYVKP